VVALACTLPALLIGGHVGLAHAVVGAACLASATLLVEATSWQGLDNLLVPLSSAGLLSLVLHIGPLGLATTALGIGALLALGFWWRRSRPMTAAVSFRQGAHRVAPAHGPDTAWVARGR
jgi:hypothetical protein